MTRIISLAEIQQALPTIDVVELMEEGFVEYSQGRVVVPPVGELLFEEPPGDAHIKYGYIEGDDHFVIKIAAGFYRNPELGLSSSQGLMLVFSQQTGVPEAVLLDGGQLTNVRTAAAGAVAAKYLAATSVDAIGILGAGIQAELQLRYLQQVRPCRRVLFWTPEASEIEAFHHRLADADLDLEAVDEPREIAARCNVIVTATPTTEPLLETESIRPGTHITAVGSDTAEKIELEPGILATADLVVADSLEQSKSRGEIFRAVSAGALSREKVRELGAIISQGRSARTRDDEISVCDLTGVAVQDIQIAKAILVHTRQTEEERG